MRLTSKEQTTITDTIGKYDAKLKLFGSRVDDNARSGDIDLLLIVESTEFKTELMNRKHYLLSDIKAIIGDQRIDLKIIEREKLTSDAFAKMILPTSIVLKNYNN